MAAVLDGNLERQIAEIEEVSRQEEERERVYQKKMAEEQAQVAAQQAELAQKNDGELKTQEQEAEMLEDIRMNSREIGHTLSDEPDSDSALFFASLNRPILSAAERKKHRLDKTREGKVGESMQCAWSQISCCHPDADAYRRHAARTHAVNLTLKCGDHEWTVNASILRAASPKLASACEKDGSIIGEEVPDAVGAVIKFINTGDYDDEAYDQIDYPADFTASTMTFNVYVYGLAIKFGMQALAKIAKKRFHAVAASRFADKAFACAIKEAYTRDSRHTRELQDLILKICMEQDLAEKIVSGALYLTPAEIRTCEHLLGVSREVYHFKQDLEKTLSYRSYLELPRRPRAAPMSLAAELVDPPQALEHSRKMHLELESLKLQRLAKVESEKRYRCFSCSLTFVTANVLLTKRSMCCLHCGKIQDAKSWAKTTVC